MAILARRIELSSGWSFKQTDSSDEWLPVSKTPSVSHLDLIANKKIPDPFVGLNEIDVEWVGEKSWTYRTSFVAPKQSEGASIYLIFEGLDTFATVRLNDTVILESDNMFLNHRVEVTKWIQQDNVLNIDFDSALLRGRALEQEHPEHRFIAHNGETGRLAVRKAQYHWVSSAHIDDISIDYSVADDLGSAAGTVHVQFQGQVDEIRLSIKHLQKEMLANSVKVDSMAVLDFKLEGLKLWYPVGYGSAELYDVAIELVQGSTVVDTITKNTGFRKAELAQKEDAHGESFYFRVNNIDVFAGGSCWIPTDNLLPRITKQKYRNWLNLMIEGNQIMTRVWGGGIYEDDAFYEICDELGILVWQDFMFACGSYPAWQTLRDSVEQEARQNVRRLRHHPSIVLYAGNNEDHQIQEHYQLEYDYGNKDAESWLQSGFPARYYYEYLLGKVVADESPSVPYWPSSPFSKGNNSFDLTIGDFGILEEKYQTFDKIGGRSNSEFGLEAFPDMRTIESFVTKPSDLYPQSHVLDFHNKADGHERRIATYVVENFRPPADLEVHIYLTQLMQSEALAYAYRGWRRQWGEQRRCGGALVWQINDCWPCTSWAIVDYHLRKKPGFYSISRALRPVTVGVQREHHDWSVCHARPAKQSVFSVWVSSSKQKDFTADVEIRFVSIATGEDIKPAVRKAALGITSNGTTSVYTGTIDNLKEEPHVLAVRLISGNQVLARDMDWPQPFKCLSFENRGVEIDATGGRYAITAKRPTKGLVLAELDEQTLSDNCIDLVPGDAQY